MKSLRLTALILMLIMTSGYAWGAAMTVTYGGTQSETWNNDQRIRRVKLTCTQADANDPDAFLLSSVSSPSGVPLSNYRAAIFFQFETDPGTAPDATYTLAIASDKGAPIISLTGLSVTATAMHNGAQDLGFTPIIWDLSIDFGDLGSANDSVDLYLYFIK